MGNSYKRIKVNPSEDDGIGDIFSDEGNDKEDC